ncbi:hypothetical protein BDQ12DRAFT_666513 [Crucibulum laeve]|uniref:PIPK domain-containing protein n=1 Tax=Crucibulum laeve TaxID=68775 RepID=A0A5C3LZB4_9AGAR|nr:hypothetical protein BDQ12DRAFT_666513 [Crucibulum laeve]
MAMFTSKRSSMKSVAAMILSALNMGRDYTSKDPSGSVLLGPGNALPTDPDFHSPGTRKQFSLFHLFASTSTLKLAAPALFAHLRDYVFLLPPDVYYDQHLTAPRKDDQQDPESVLKSETEELGLSGASFFTTHDKGLIVKSVTRGFESSFLLHSMLEAYAIYLLSLKLQNEYSLLSPITDVLYPPYYTFAGALGLGMEGAIWIVMQNTLLLHASSTTLEGDSGTDSRIVSVAIPVSQKWDLKPPSFFEPFRDLVPDNVRPSGLADAELPIHHRPVISKETKKQIMHVLERDTKFLEEMGSVDYSILLGQWEVSSLPRDFPFPSDKTASWAEGVLSKDRLYIYKVAIVDFLWSQEAGLRPMVTRAAGKVVPQQTTTADPDMYREEFLRMCNEYFLTEVLVSEANEPTAGPSSTSNKD